MRMLVLAAACGALFATTASAQSLSGSERYVSISGVWAGESDYSVDYPNNAGTETVEHESGMGAQLAFGTRAGAWRLEGALSQRTHDARSSFKLAPGYTAPSDLSGEVEVRAIDLNAYYDLPTGTTFRPYVGAGAGLAQASIEGPILNDDASTLQLQVMAGVSIDVSPRVALFAEGRMQRVGDFQVETFSRSPLTGQEFTGEDEVNFSNAAVLAGVRFGF
jgi:opacity protein-like surface antigen